MPTFKPLGAKIRLVHFDLAESTTTNLVREKKRAGDETKLAEDKILAANTFGETPIPCFGDTTRLHFLNDVPFYLVEAHGQQFDQRKVPQETRSSVLDIDSTQASLHEATPAQVSIPRAVALILTLPQTAFVHNFHKKPERDASQKRFHDVKWDVFFNGEHVLSDFESSRNHDSKNTKIEPKVDNGNLRLMSGIKRDILIERAWVVEPPLDRMHGTGEIRTDDLAKAAEKRWNEIGRALHRHAHEIGYNMYEERSPLGDYLANLAAMPMPEAMVQMQSVNGKKYGVIDVVISAGFGKKGATSGYSNHYLIGPEALFDGAYEKMPPNWSPSGQLVISRREFAERTDMNIDPALLGLTSTAAFSRSRRSTLPPRNMSPSKSFLPLKPPSTPKPSSPSKPTSHAKSAEATPETFHAATSLPSRILPPFPQVAPIDFNDAISITPTKTERYRGVIANDDTHAAALQWEMNTNMPPPMTIPRSTHARCRSASVMSTDMPSSSSPNRQGPYHPRPGGSPGSKSVSGYMGMTKRGIFSQNANVQFAPPDIYQGSLGAFPGRTSLMPSTAPLKRIIIHNQLSPVVDRQLTSPYVLREEASSALLAQVPPSLHQTVHQPLQDSAVFQPRKRQGGGKAVKSTKHASMHPALTPISNFVSLPPPIFAPSAPRCNASPPTAILHTALRPANPARGTTTTTNKIASASPHKRKSTTHPKKKVTPEMILEEERTKWSVPELSKDCILTYADEKWLELTGGSVIRHVKSSRAGVFTENEVLFAVRFVVPS